MEKTEVAKRIKSLREEKKLTQNALANIAGVSPTYIYQLERGEKSPTVEYLNYICWGLGVTLEEFFRTSPDQPTEDKISSLSPTQKQRLNEFLNTL